MTSYLLSIFEYYYLVHHSFLPEVQSELEGLSWQNVCGFKCRRHMVQQRKKQLHGGKNDRWEERIKICSRVLKIKLKNEIIKKLGETLLPRHCLKVEGFSVVILGLPLRWWYFCYCCFCYCWYFFFVVVKLIVVKLCCGFPSSVLSLTWCFFMP